MLFDKLPQYRYKAFLKNQKSSIGVGVLSKFKIISTNAITISKIDLYSRPILEVIFKIDNFKFKLYNNHWRSKRAGENERIKYAVALKNYISKIDDDSDYILVGDFNSNYNEWITFESEKKLNNTYGITGINHVLNTVINDKLIIQNDMLNSNQRIHYNLWLELNKEERFSTIFRNQKNTPDNILLSTFLFDNKNISYLDNSFDVFKPSYLYKHNRITRWNKNSGYSDHLPIIASFTTDTNNSSQYIKDQNSIANNNKLNYLYEKEHIRKPIALKNMVVIYKYQNGAILQEVKGRSIYVYKCVDDLKIGGIYNLVVNDVQLYNGLLEITSISDISLISVVKNYKTLYKNASKIDIFDKQYINDIITSLSGIYKKRYLYFKDKKIRLFFSKNVKLIKDNTKITINSGHLSIYKGQIQITIHKKSDIIEHD